MHLFVYMCVLMCVYVCVNVYACVCTCGTVYKTVHPCVCASMFVCVVNTINKCALFNNINTFVHIP